MTNPDTNELLDYLAIAFPIWCNAHPDRSALSRNKRWTLPEVLECIKEARKLEKDFWAKLYSSALRERRYYRARYRAEREANRAAGIETQLRTTWQD